MHWVRSSLFLLFFIFFFPFFAVLFRRAVVAVGFICVSVVAEHGTTVSVKTEDISNTSSSSIGVEITSDSSVEADAIADVEADAIDHVEADAIADVAVDAIGVVVPVTSTKFADEAVAAFACLKQRQGISFINEF